MIKLQDMYRELEQYNTISFDIFNTIIMRTVSKPEEIFVLLGERLLEEGILTIDYTKESFGKLRQQAEKCVIDKKKQAGESEYFLEEIYNAFPTFFCFDSILLAKKELEIECEYTYLNPDIYEIINYLHRAGKKVLLISDMYFRKEQIEEILDSCGFDITLISEIYVSSEYGVNKSSGVLFDVVLNRNGLVPSEMVHIGDSVQADIIGARKRKIRAIHYDIFNRLPLELVYEKMCFECGITLLYSSRLIMNQRLKHHSQDFWYRQGALIWGPVLALYADWIVDTAIKNKIVNIYPLMREGVLLTKIINKAVEKRGIEINVKPMYVSRHTTLSARFDGMCKELYDYCIEQPYMTIGGIFELLGLEIKDTIYQEIMDISLQDFSTTGRYAELYNYFCEEKVAHEIVYNIKQNRKVLFDYIDTEFDIEHPYITCDIGFAGSISTAIDSIIRREGQDNRNIHCMLMTTENAMKNVFSNSVILGFIQEFADRKKSYCKFFPLLEGLFMGMEGSTVGYQRNGAKIIPIKGDTIVSDNEYFNRYRFQNGVMDYLELYFKCNIQGNRKESRCQTVRVLERLFLCPTHDEAIQYREQRFEQNIGKMEIFSINIKDELSLYQSLKEEDFLKQAKIRNILWPEADIALQNPLYNYKQCMQRISNKDYYMLAMMDICDRLKVDEIQQVMVYGAGDVGCVLADLLNVYDINAMCFIDKNPMLWGKEIMPDVYVCGIEEAVKKYRNKPVVIASFAWIEDIRNTIYSYMGNVPIYYYLQDDQL